MQLSQSSPRLLIDHQGRGVEGGGGGGVHGQQGQVGDHTHKSLSLRLNASAHVDDSGMKLLVCPMKLLAKETASLPYETTCE